MDSTPAPATSPRRESDTPDPMATAIPAADASLDLMDGDEDEDFLDIPILMDIAPDGVNSHRERP